MKRLMIILADDHPVVLVGAQQILAHDGSMDVVGLASTVDELLALVTSVPCDVLVTDFHMPGGIESDGDAMLRKLRRVRPSLPIVVLTMTANLAVLVQMLDTGVIGIVDKTADIRELPKAITSAYQKRKYISAGLKQRLCASDITHRDLNGMASLSVSELRVVHMFSNGMSVTGIADKLNKSVSTISRQKNNAMDKLGIDNNVQLVDFVRGAT